MSFSRFSRRVISSACAPVQRVLVEQLEARRLLAGNGLQGDYYNGKDFNTLVTTRTDATVDFDWGYGSPAVGVDGNFFSTRWTGKIQPPATGNYTFYTTSDDGIRLWVNGQQIVNNWTDHAATENSGSITLTGGQLYDIRIEYYEGINNALARLSWAGPGISKQVVPNGVLFTPDTTGPVEPQPTLPMVNLSVSKGSVNELPSDTATVTVTRTGPTTEPLVVTLNRSGSATNNTDYTLPATVTIPVGAALASVTFTPIDDALIEGNEVANLSIAPSGLYTLGNSTATVTIIDNDVPPVGDGSGLKAEYFNGRNFDNKVTERNDATVNFDWGYNAPVAGVGADNFSVRWTGQVLASSTGSYTFYTTSDDGVRLWVNGVQIINQWNDHAPTEHSGTINLVAGQKYDIRMEYYEAGNGATAQLRWSGPGVAKQVIPTSALFSSTTPAPVLPNVTITSSDTQGAEAGQNPVSFTITRTGDTTSALTVSLGYSGTASANDFTTALPSTLTIPAGQSSATVMLIPIDDAAYEGNETLVVMVSANANYTLGTPSSVTLNIADNDTPPQTGTGDGLKAEYFNGRSFETKIAERTDSTINFDWGYGTPIAGVGADNFSVRWTGQVLASSTGAYTFYTTSDDGVRLWVNGVQIINQWNDHAPTEHSGTINLVAGQKYDIRMEYYEAGNGATAQLRWSGPGVAKQVIPTSALFSSTTPAPVLPVVTIVDRVMQATEQETLSFVVSRTGSTASRLVVNLVYANKVLSDADIVGDLPKSIVIPAGQSEVLVELVTVNDFIVEGVETLEFRIAPGEQYALPSDNPWKTLLLRDDDMQVPAPVVEIKRADGYLGYEGQGTFRFVVTRTGDLSRSLSVQVNYAGSLTAEDFTGNAFPPPVVIIPYGSSSAIIDLPTRSDRLIEGTETIRASLVPNGAYTIGAAGEADIYVRDADRDYGEITRNGFSAMFSTGMPDHTNTVYRLDQAIDFDWGENQPPTPGIDGDNFVAMWYGTITPPASGTWTFYVQSAGSVLFTVNSTTLVDAQYEHATMERSGGISLVGGRSYSIGLQYMESTGNAGVKLSWSGPGVSKQVVTGNYVATRPPGWFMISTEDRDITEGEETVGFNIRGGRFPYDVDVLLAYSGSATSDDFVGGLPSKVRIPAGATQVPVMLTPIKDGKREGLEFLTAVIMPSPDYMIEGTAPLVLTIHDA